MLNPNTIALLMAMTMLLLDIRLPVLVQDSLGGLGGTTLYLAMIYIGILLSSSRLLDMVRRWDVLFLSFNKLLLMPALIMALFWVLFTFTDFQMSHLALSVVVLEASMPCMTILVLLAKHYGANDRAAMENFVVSTVLSVVTLPVVLWLLNDLFPG
jgi:predicted permease